MFLIRPDIAMTTYSVRYCQSPGEHESQYHTKMNGTVRINFHFKNVGTE